MQCYFITQAVDILYGTLCVRGLAYYGTEGAKLVLDWRKKQRAREDVFATVKTVLDELPRAYTPELYQQKCDTVYQHVYDSYQGEGRSIYAAAIN